MGQEPFLRELPIEASVVGNIVPIALFRRRTDGFDPAGISGRLRGDGLPKYIRKNPELPQHGEDPSAPTGLNTRHPRPYALDLSLATAPRPYDQVDFRRPTFRVKRLPPYHNCYKRLLHRPPGGSVESALFWGLLATREPDGPIQPVRPSISTDFEAHRQGPLPSCQTDFSPESRSRRSRCR
jgi:hypothetical protein